jgi:phosphate transport system permease protein
MVSIQGGQPRAPRTIVDEPTRIDRAFNAVTTGAGITVFVLLTLVGLFLLLRSSDAFDAMGTSFFSKVEWKPDADTPSFGVKGLLCGTFLVALVAFVVAVPFGVCTAVYITDFASPGLRRWLTGLVDLLAAIPSLLYGIWGSRVLTDQLVPVADWLHRNADWIPIFHTKSGATLSGSFFIAGVVVSLMTLPIVASVSREVFAQTPAAEKEAALALGGTRWGMVRKVVLPYGRAGVIGGAMLGLGRALGETIAVALILGQVPIFKNRILDNGGATIAGFIANHTGGSDLNVSGLMAIGLVLFAVTLTVNTGAAMIVARSRSGAGVEL